MLCYVILYYILLYTHTYSSKRRRCRLAGQTRTGVSVGGMVDLKGPRGRVWSEIWRMYLKHGYEIAGPTLNPNIGFTSSI
jgi:hypothetical protein